MSMAVSPLKIEEKKEPLSLSTLKNMLEIELISDKINIVPIKFDDALLIIDVQNDFVTGTLPVPDAREIFPVINAWIARFWDEFSPIIFTKDWHPEDHMSFKENGGLWVQHCIAGTLGAETCPEIIKFSPQAVDTVIFEVVKGTKSNQECYSAFCFDTCDDDGDETYLEWLLREQTVKRIFVCGLATDYCVKATVLDALKLGFDVALIRDGIRGVDVNPGDSERAIEEMKKAGAKMI